MNKIIIAFALIVSMCAGSAMANPMWYWADETGAELTGAIDAAPGDTVRVWSIGRTNMPGWPPLNRVRQELWWDTGIIANIGSGNGLLTVTPFYNDAANGMVSDLCADNYGAAEDYSFPDYAHYGNVDLWATIYYYGGMRMVGFDIPIRDDAPMGLTIVNGACLGTDYWSGSVILNERIEGADPAALAINVTPEPATLGLLGCGAMALFGKRRKQRVCA
ncbi:MAG: PEP-CTERM sorting domain-containing protein [Phycisphaerales bacterium]|nr:PEP-CTERM sorting domain-containing protein [Phycisphaerales bacterium]